MLPDGNGTAIGAQTEGQETEITESYTIDPIYDTAELRAIVFVQDITTMEVYQAAWTDPGYYKCDPSIGVNDISFDSNIINIYPVATSKNLNMEFNLFDNADVNIEVYNELGESVQTVDNGNYSYGKHSMNIDVSDLAVGVYFVTLKVNKETFSKKFIITK